MNPIDKEKIDRLFVELKKAIGELRDLSNKDKKGFLSDSHYLGSAKYHLIIAIEAIVDICNHIIAKYVLGKPESYSDIFHIMGKAGIFTNELTTKLKDMAKFRNLLVHLYWRIDDEKVYDILKEGLGNFELFEGSIREYLKNHS